MINLTTEANKNFFELLIIKYPHLKVFKLKSNILEFHDYKIELKNFRLINLNQIPNIFTFPPFELFQIIKIHSDIEDEKNYINQKEYNLNALYLEIRAILVKDIIDGEEIKKLNDFANTYKILWQHQDFLLEDAKNKFNNMHNVISENIFNENIKMTPGINELMKNLNFEANSIENSNSKYQALVLTNPKFPSSSNNDTEELKYGTYGFTSTLLIIYIVLNIGLILGILLLK